MAVLWTGLCCAGCAHPTYSPYGYGNGYGPSYGPTYPAPQYMGPGVGPTYTPQSVPPTTGSPTPLTNPPTNRDPIQWKQPTTSPSNDAPLFNTDPNKGTVPPGRDPLDDLNNANPGASLPQGNMNTAKLPVYEKGGLAAAAPPVIADVVQTVGGTATDPFFEAPSRLPPATDATPMNTESMYGHDGQSHKWLKGAVDYDDKTQTWSIVYDLNPPASDKFGGSLVITPHVDLGNLQIGDFALLEGTIDPNDRDANGRQIYTVTKVTGPLGPANPKP